ncbi:MAG: low specificity L-threonine aldolase [Bacteroidales bacterium]|nr:low specificity L-threonine aldolase [Bacteroidales bacterium]
MNKKGFASDNNSGVHPEIMIALTEANKGHTVAYGDDAYTREARKAIQHHLGERADPYFVFLGTGANVLGIGALSSSFHSVICAETAHIQEDECGAPEKFNGIKLLPVETDDGKIRVEGIEPHVKGIGFEHHSQPRIISITQATELGTVYKPEEIKEIAEYAHQNGIYVHMDGARIANAAASLNVSLREITTDAGVDILSFGGTKNGLMYGEAVVFLNAQAPDEFKFIRKQGMQLASKMRFISAQFLRYLSSDLWYQTAQHANEMARLLAEEAEKVPGIEVTQKVEANGVFARVPRDIIPRLQEEFFFYIWDEPQSVVRWMTSFDTTEQEIYDFVGLIRRLVDKG